MLMRGRDRRSRRPGKGSQITFYYSNQPTLNPGTFPSAASYPATPSLRSQDPCSPPPSSPPSADGSRPR
jgi:hypothetical protein